RSHPGAARPLLRDEPVTLIERRIGLIFAGFLVLLAIAAVRSFQLGVVDRSSLASAASAQQLINADVPAERGAIVDRGGKELAVSEASGDVSATPYLIKDPVRVAAKLAGIVDEPEADLLKQLTRKDTGFVYLAKGVTGARADKVRALNIEGIDVAPGYKRWYPQATLASQVLGITGADGEGKTGLEYSLEDTLRGEDGQRSTVRDGVGESVSVRDTKKSVPGARVQLTIDSAIQAKVESVLAGVGRTYDPKGATAVVMDPKTGSVYAMANWPAVDANQLLPRDPYLSQNRAVGYTYEPGSTFKAITVAGALEDKVVTPDSVFTLPPTLQIYDRVIKEAHERGWAEMNVSQILAESSNVGAVTIALEQRKLKGKTRFDMWARRFGFGKKTGIDLPGEEQGILLQPKDYSGATIANLPIGQGLAVTQVQMAQAYAAVANGGILREPHLIGAVDGKVTPPAAGQRIISAQTSAQLRHMLKGTFQAGGTAYGVSLDGYDFAGKTGTAEKIDPQTGTYSKDKYVASFIGFAPAGNPGLLISVMVDEPKAVTSGGSVAAPAFAKIAEFALPQLGIPSR
ncbi:MAG TPA: penicillin-binding protein 2, partial [Baekduia sp.]|nr:penicillin-binding protein 2 [Baekduia sp.]